VIRGSGAQARVARPETRRRWLLIVGDDHVEVGSSLRSAAAFGFRDVFLEDLSCGWFDGPAAKRREARAAARRHKNPLRLHRATLDDAARYQEILVVTPFGPGVPIQRERIARGNRQLIVIGARTEEMGAGISDRVRVATLGLEPVQSPPQRLVASIALAEIARQVGRRHPVPGVRRPSPRYKKAVELVLSREFTIVDPSDLLRF
jgi:hypothetical protein